MTRAEALYEISFKAESNPNLENFARRARTGKARITFNEREIMSYWNENFLTESEIEAMKVLGLYNKEYRLTYGYDDEPVPDFDDVMRMFDRALNIQFA